MLFLVGAFFFGYARTFTLDRQGEIDAIHPLRTGTLSLSTHYPDSVLIVLSRILNKVAFQIDLVTWWMSFIQYLEWPVYHYWDIQDSSLSIQLIVCLNTLLKDLDWEIINKLFISAKAFLSSMMIHL